MRILFFLLTFVIYTIATAQSLDSLVDAAKQQLLLNKPDAAITLIEPTINATTNAQQKQQALKIMSDAWQQKGNDKKAIDFLNKMIKIKDSANIVETEKALDVLKANYEADKQKRELELKEVKIAKQQTIIAALAITSILIIAFIFLLYKRKQSLLKSQLQTTLLIEKNNAAKKILEAEEKERKRIAEDLHDGIGQMMSAVKMNISSLADKIEFTNELDKNLIDKTLALADESCKEIRNISHSMMPNALLKTGLSSAVKTFLDKIDHKKINVQLHTDGLENKLDDNVEIVLYRVIQETVNNVIKHAKANQLDISIIKDEDGIACTIEDNGVGFDTTTLNNGIGLKNIQSRVAYLNGTVEFNTAINKGTLVAIHVPC